MNVFSSYYYTIRLQGSLEREWACWLDEMTIEYEFDAQGRRRTTLRGLVRDQAALFGLLMRIRDLGLPLISVQAQE